MISTKKLLYKVVAKIGGMYPVGSCYTTNTRQNPSSWLGGSWTLVNKRFKPQWITSGFTFNSTNTRNGDFTAILNGNTIEFRFTWENKTVPSENTQTIGTLNRAAVGISSGAHGVYPVGFSDALNAVLIGIFDISAAGDGALKIYDWIGQSGRPTATGATCDMSFTIVMRANYMLDSFCDEFVWKRTA